jgi:translation initiation factor IF-2
MAENIRLNKVLRELNISIDRAIDFLESKSIEIEKRPTTKISLEIYELLSDEFQTDANKKVASKELGEAKSKEKEALRIKREAEIELLLKKKEEDAKVITAASKLKEVKKVGKIDLQPNLAKNKAVKSKESVESSPNEIKKTVTNEKTPNEVIIDPEKSIATTEKVVNKDVNVGNQDSKDESDTVTTKYKKLSGLKSTGETIDLSKFKSEKKKESPSSSNSKRKRRRISKPNDNAKTSQKPGQRTAQKSNFKPKNTTSTREEPSAEEVQKQVRETLEKLQGKSSKGKGAKYRKEKRDQHRQKTEDELANVEAESKLLKVTEFVTASEVATMMDVSVTEIISACMTLGMMVTMNQRLDAETLSIVAEEFGYSVEFVTADIEDSIEEILDNEEDLKPRAPIVTVMGHVDHGKTSLLDYIRKENVIAGESGGITQHIGAYSVELSSGQKITFLDTPGHEAFTAMRARGAQVTDLAIIVIAADDDIMPQTKEAISHAQAAGVPIVFAINKIDRPTANPDKIKEGLSQMNLLVEDWGGKIQSHDISALKGDGVDDLLEKVLLEAELLELKANPNRASSGTVVEAFLDKGRGYVSTILVQTGTLKIGDYVLAGKIVVKLKPCMMKEVILLKLLALHLQYQFLV